MATDVIMPKLGNSVESCIICAWKKAVGDLVAVGETLCEVETDKAVMEVESSAAGTLLARYYAVGDEVPVQVPIASIGEAGEKIETLDSNVPESAPSEDRPENQPAQRKISPRARKLAEELGINDSRLGNIVGRGPGGRILASDIQAFVTEERAAEAASPATKISPLAQAMVERAGYQAPARGTGPGGRVMTRDLRSMEAASDAKVLSALPTPTDAPDPASSKPLSRMRKLIAQRMVESLQTTAQLTFDSSADARALLAYRARLKASKSGGRAEWNLQNISLNALVLFAVARTLPHFPALNAHLIDDEIITFNSVALGFAVDTPRGLLVPVVRDAHTLSLQRVAQEMARLAAACLDGTILPDELSGATFTVTNLGIFGVEHFTPILNAPQVGILGVGSINPKPRWKEEIGGPSELIPQMGLSLTIDHRAIDGAPAARFLQTLCQNIADFELLLAL